MNKMNWVATAAAVAWLSASGAFAAVVLSENFEGLADNEQLLSQLGTFESVGENSTAGTLLTGQDYGSGAPGTGFNSEGGDTAIFFNRVSANNLRLKQDADFDLGAAYDATLAHSISFDFYNEGSAPTTDIRLLMTEATGGLADGMDLTIFNAFGRVKNNNTAFGAALKNDTWYRYELVINPLDTANDTFDITVTESGVGTPVISQTGLAFKNDISDIARMEFQMFNNQSQTATVFFDNISVTNSLPEGVNPPVFIDEHFTTAEGYTAGPLANGWGGDHVADFTVDPTGTGTVSLPTNSVGFKRAVYQTALTSNTIYKAGAEFSFSRDNSTPTKNAGLISVEISELNTIGVGNGRIAMQLERYKNFPGQFYLKLIDQNGTSAFPASGSFNETKMGIDTNAALSASDDLGLYFEIVRGATSNDWSGTGTLSNLTAGTEVKSFEFTFDTSAAYFNDDSLYPVLGSLNSETDHFCLDRTVDRFTARTNPVKPTSSGVDLRAVQAAEGVYVEFTAYDVEADGSIMLALMDGETIVWSDTVEVIAGPQFVARFLVPGLELGESYHFKVRDEVGKWWDAPGVTVQDFAAEMVSATLAGIELTFDSQPESAYTIDWTDSLGGTWQTVTSVTAVAQQTTLVVEYPEGGSGFFRVQAQ